MTREGTRVTKSVRPRGHVDLRRYEEGVDPTTVYVDGGEVDRSKLSRKSTVEFPGKETIRQRLRGSSFR